MYWAPLCTGLCVLGLPVSVLSRSKLGSFCKYRGGLYFSPRLLCRFNLPTRAISIRRRIASERDGLSFCCLAQFSMANRVLGGSRTVRTGSWPVAGRPRFFGVTVINSL